jgi:chaperonin cofactor prefoldin
MRYKLFPVVALATLFALLGCGGGQDYSDAVEINTKFVDAMGSYIDDIDKADGAADVADAIDAYAQKVEELAPQMKAIAAKHPEWKDMGKVPEELKPIQEKAKQIASQIPNTFMKTMKYMTDDQVRDAHKRLQESMAKMQ